MMALCLVSILLTVTPAQLPRPRQTLALAGSTIHAAGTFAVDIKPTGEAPAPGLGSYSLDKQYHGDLEASAKGEMLSAGSSDTGNAGYVAIERVTGRLQGKTGSFALMQTATMSTGSAPQMTVTIVPGSGTGELSGIAGSMAIRITGGKHFYTLDYTLAGQ